MGASSSHRLFGTLGASGEVSGEPVERNEGGDEQLDRVVVKGSRDPRARFLLDAQHLTEHAPTLSVDLLGVRLCVAPTDELADLPASRVHRRQQGGSRSQRDA